MRLLDDLGESADTLEYSREDTEGNVHTVLYIPGRYVDALIQARARDTDSLFRFRLFKTTKFNDRLGDGEFVSAKHKPRKVKITEGALWRHVLKRSSRNR